jgi:hypothetical protein
MLTEGGYLSLKALQEIVNKAVLEVEDASQVPVQLCEIEKRHTIESILPLKEVFIINIGE